MFFVYELSLCFSRGWEQVRLRRAKSTLETLMFTKRILFGRMNKMEKRLNLHLVKKKLKLERTGFHILRYAGQLSTLNICSLLIISACSDVGLFFQPGTHLDQKQQKISFSDFVNKELILFSMADLQRSIPSMVDGLKPGQRKILFCSFKRNFTKEAKVAQFSGYVSEHSAYHHGEQSLASTIIGMAQDYVGSNNINLLQPNGQFGTRNMVSIDIETVLFISYSSCTLIVVGWKRCSKPKIHFH